MGAALYKWWYPSENEVEIDEWLSKNSILPVEKLCLHMSGLDDPTLHIQIVADEFHLFHSGKSYCDDDEDSDDPDGEYSTCRESMKWDEERVVRYLRRLDVNTSLVLSCDEFSAFIKLFYAITNVRFHELTCFRNVRSLKICLKETTSDFSILSLLRRLPKLESLEYSGYGLVDALCNREILGGWKNLLLFLKNDSVNFERLDNEFFLHGSVRSSGEFVLQTEVVIKWHIRFIDVLDLIEICYEHEKFRSQKWQLKILPSNGFKLAEISKQLESMDYLKYNIQPDTQSNIECHRIQITIPEKPNVSLLFWVAIENE